MKNVAVITSIAMAVGIAIASAQSQVQPIAPPSGGNYYGGGGYPVSSHSSTAAEGRLRGMGDLVRSAGQANLDNSAAAVNYSVAQRSQIENRSLWTSTYFEMRQTNRAYRNAERSPRPSMESLVRFAQAGKPKPLSTSDVDAVSGAIEWPVLLRSDDFADSRSTVEEVFAARAAKSSIGSNDYLAVKQTTDAMLADLSKQIREVPPNQYMTAKKFIESLAYEASLPAT